MAENIQISGIQFINDFVSTWTNKYLYQTTYQDYTAQGYTFCTEFSLPIQEKPIPTATVKVYFYLNPSKGEKGDEIDMKFRFENDSLIHKPDRTLRIQRMEKWLEKFLDKKSQTSKVLFLGTEFEATRIKHERLDKIFEEMNFKEEIKEEKYLSKELLDQDNELEIDEEFCDEQVQIETMKQTLFNVFRSVDQEDMGVLSRKECQEVFKQMGLQLTEEEWTEILNMADTKKNGLIEYKEFIEIGAEMIHGIFMKNSANKNLSAREEEYLLQSILILHGSELHDIIGVILDDLIKQDEDEEGIVSILPNLKQTLNKHTEVINPNEVDEIIKIIQKTYDDNVFPYKELYTVLLDYKVYNLKNGLMESSLNKLEIYLRSICEPYDKDKKQLIHIDDLMRALENSDKIILSKTQTYIIRSFMERDENGCVNYIIGSRILSAMIKKFFTPSILIKKAKLIEDGLIKEDEYMKGWSQEEVETELEEIFKKVDKKNQDFVDIDQVKGLIKNSKLGITEDELQASFRQASNEQEGYVTVEEFKDNFYSILKSLRCQVAIAKLAEI